MKQLTILLLLLSVVVLSGCGNKSLIGQYVDCDYHGSGIITYATDDVVVFSGKIIDEYLDYEDGTFTYKEGKTALYKFHCPSLKSDRELVKEFLCSAKLECGVF